MDWYCTFCVFWKWAHWKRIIYLTICKYLPFNLNLIFLNLFEAPKMGKLVLDLVKGLTWSEEKYIFFFPFLKQITKTVPPWCRIQKKVVHFWVRVKIFWPLGQVKKQLLKLYFLNWDLFTIWHNLLNAFFSSSQKSIHPLYYTVWMLISISSLMPIMSP